MDNASHIALLLANSNNIIEKENITYEYMREKNML